MVGDTLYSAQINTPLAINAAEHGHDAVGANDDGANALAIAIHGNLPGEGNRDALGHGIGRTAVTVQAADGADEDEGPLPTSWPCGSSACNLWCSRRRGHVLLSHHVGSAAVVFDHAGGVDSSQEHSNAGNIARRGFHSLLLVDAKPYLLRALRAFGRTLTLAESPLPILSRKALYQ